MLGRRWGLVVCALLLVSCTSSGSSSEPAPATEASAETTTSPAATIPSATTTPSTAAADAVADAGWPVPGYDLDNSRAAAIGSRITSSNVSQLEPAWEATIEGGLTTVPIVVDGIVYLGDSNGRVTALDQASGKVRWASQPTGPNIGPFGVAVAGGRVFALLGSTGVVALDATSGKRIWESKITTTPSEGVDIQPLVVDGIVLVSTVPVSIAGIYVGGDHGVIYALDAATGATRWTFDTVDSSDVWGNPGVNSGGGAWYPPAVDRERGLVYFGIANPAPFPGTPDFPNGSSRPGPNLYTDSVVALDLHTGALRWYHQVHAHDLFDRDLVNTMIVRLDGGREVVIGTGKGGVVVALDPDTGALAWQTPVGHHENDELTKLSGPTVVAPGPYGGVISPPASAGGIVYTVSVDAPTRYVPNATAYFAADVGQAPGVMTAVDARDGSVKWTIELPGDPFGAATVVNDLVLTALLDGTLLAVERDDGSVRWRTKLTGGVNGWMAVTDDELVVPVGLASPPRVVAYRLP